MMVSQTNPHYTRFDSRVQTPACRRASQVRPERNGPPRSWRSLAACAGCDPGLFYEQACQRVALACCATCQVAEPCLFAALDFEEDAVRRFGVFGGTTARQRAEIAQYLADRHLRPSDLLDAEERWWRTLVRKDARSWRS